MRSIEKPDHEVSSLVSAVANVEPAASPTMREVCDWCGKPVRNWVLRKGGLRPRGVCFQCVIAWFGVARDSEGRR